MHTYELKTNKQKSGGFFNLQNVQKEYSTRLSVKIILKQNAELDDGYLCVFHQL